MNRGIPVDEQYIESVTSGLTAYTNTVFFGYIRFIMLIVLIYMLAILYKVKNR